MEKGKETHMMYMTQVLQTQGYRKEVLSSLHLMCNSIHCEQLSLTTMQEDAHSSLPGSPRQLPLLPSYPWCCRQPRVLR